MFQSAHLWLEDYLYHSCHGFEARLECNLVSVGDATVSPALECQARILIRFVKPSARCKCFSTWSTSAMEILAKNGREKQYPETYKIIEAIEPKRVKHFRT